MANMIGATGFETIGVEQYNELYIGTIVGGNVPHKLSQLALSLPIVPRKQF